jgi:hypothetical protein
MLTETIAPIFRSLFPMVEHWAVSISVPLRPTLLKSLINT